MKNQTMDDGVTEKTIYCRFIKPMYFSLHDVCSPNNIGGS